MKLVVFATIAAAISLSACASGYGYGHRYHYGDRYWDHRERECHINPNGRRVCTWRYF